MPGTCLLQRAPATVLAGVTVAVVMSLVARHAQIKYLGASERIKKLTLPEGVTWIDQSAFDVLVAISDTLLPSLTVNECSDEQIIKTFELLGIASADPTLGISLTNLRHARAFLSVGAVELRTPEHVAKAVQQLISVPDQKQLNLILGALGSSLGTLVLSGYPAPFTSLSRRQREAVLKSFAQSSFETVRSIFSVFKRLVGSIFLSYAEKGKENSTWASLDYGLDARAGPLPANADDKALRHMVSYPYVLANLPSAIDVIIVGSGCGGGIAAHELVEAGFSVVVLEKGGYYRQSDFAQWTECEAMAKCFEKGGLCTSSDSNVIFLAGSCVGGGSTINWSASFPPPEHVLEEWAAQGLDRFGPGGPFLASVEAVTKLMKVNTDNSFHSEACPQEGASFKVNGNNRKLWAGAEAAGYSPEKIPRNVKDCKDCGHCCFGCSHDSKQSTIHTLMEPILLRQHRGEGGKGKLFIIPDCHVHRIVTSTVGGQKVATGVDCTATIFRSEGSDRIPTETHRFSLSAKVIISAAGAMQTPPLLLRSAMQHPLVGANLTIHPVLGVGGLYAEHDRTELNRGVSMGVVVRNPPICQPSDPAHSVAIETPPIHAGLMGIIAPYHTALGYKIATLGWKNLSVFLGISRDVSQPSNRVSVDQNGDMVIHYRVAEHDKPMLIAGLEAMVRLTYAAGAKLIFVSHASMPWFASDKDKQESDKKFEAYVQMAKQDKIEPFKMSVVAAHQMSSCRMAARTEEGPVGPTGEMFECKNLFVADGSLLPTSLGINPMVTIEAMAHMVSHDVIERLRASAVN